MQDPNELKAHEAALSPEDFENPFDAEIDKLDAEEDKLRANARRSKSSANWLINELWGDIA